jgi:hypothetical protein
MLTVHVLCLGAQSIAHLYCGPFQCDFLRAFVFAQALKRRMTDSSIAGPFRKYDFGDQFWPHPMGISSKWTRWPCREWACLLLQSIEPLSQFPRPKRSSVKNASCSTMISGAGWQSKARSSAGRCCEKLPRQFAPGGGSVAKNSNAVGIDRGKIAGPGWRRCRNWRKLTELKSEAVEESRRRAQPKRAPCSAYPLCYSPYMARHAWQNGPLEIAS